MRNKREEEAKTKTDTGAEAAKNKQTVTETAKDKQTENVKDRWTGEHDFRYRKFLILLIAACTVLEGGFAGIISEQSQERQIVLLFVGLLYAILFVTALEIQRLKQEWLFEKLGDYRKLAVFYLMTCVVAVLFLYLPEFVRPALLLSMAISMVVSPVFGMVSGVFHCTVYMLCGSQDIYILLFFLLLLLCGCFASSFLDKNEYSRWGMAFLFLFTFAVVMVFSYLSSGRLEKDLMIYALCNGVLSAAGAIWLYHICSSKPGETREQALKKILSENFGLVREMQRFSSADYEHAKKVSQISEKCARIVAADPYVAAAGGFYYRLGRMDGKPYVENGVALARINYLPGEIIEILKEYNGEKKLPSTVESAIVHIVDSVVAKFDVLDKGTLSSSWNQDIIVYQTLNENSAAGLYDKSGLGMNMYLKIRDYLIKEAKLL